MTARVNLIIDQGATFYQEVELTDQNDDPLQITYANGDPIYTATSQLRKSYQTSNVVNFDIAMSNGVMILSMTANTTENIVGGRYVYDAELTAFDQYSN